MAYGKLSVGLVAAACLWATTQPARAQTLVETLVNTYTNNPQIEAERARQRSNDEDVARARGGWRPTVTFYGEGGRGHDTQRQRSPVGTTLQNSFYRDPAQARIILQQNIYDGGRTIADVERSEQTVMRGREVLNATEQQALLEGVNAHLDVYRDLQIRSFINDLLVALQRQQRGIIARRAVGDATTTDAAFPTGSSSTAISKPRVRPISGSPGLPRPTRLKTRPIRRSCPCNSSTPNAARSTIRTFGPLFILSAWPRPTSTRRAAACGRISACARVGTAISSRIRRPSAETSAKWR
jgi:hypothetical protein